ncbi:MAG: AIR synthase family protein [Candidatus Brockarchaeota archaeon]|nr:AIR synthase family protein [Candidatus Brockarchaeota archaeon]
MGKILGKVPPEILEQIVFKNLGAKNRRVLVGPGIGVDNTVISLNGIKIVVSSDPVTGARENLGRIGVDVSTNDVATSGAKPEFLLVSLILPPGTREESIERIMRQASLEAWRLGVCIVGGHTEYAHIVENPIFVGTAIGWTKRRKLITSSGAKPGEEIVIIGEAGVEGTSILALDMRRKLKSMGVPTTILKRASMLVKSISIVKQALIAADYVSAMHDPTEGGVLGGIYEICEASSTGCLVNLSSIPVRKETRIICEKLDLDPLKLISSGSLLATVKRDKSDKLIEKLRARGFKATVIGRITRGRRRVGILEGKEVTIDEPPQDELWKALSKS